MTIEQEYETILRLMTQHSSGKGLHLYLLRGYVMGELGVSEHRANKLINELVIKGLLLKNGNGMGRQVWQSADYATHQQARQEYQLLRDETITRLKAIGVFAADYGLYSDSLVVSTRDMARFLARLRPQEEEAP